MPFCPSLPFNHSDTQTMKTANEIRQQTQRIVSDLLKNISPRQTPKHPNVIRACKVITIGAEMIDAIQ